MQHILIRQSVGLGLGCEARAHLCAACRAAVSPSYHVQALFAQHAGAWSVPTSIEANAASMVAVSTTCADADCKKLDCKVCVLRGC